MKKILMKNAIKKILFLKKTSEKIVKTICNNTTYSE